MKKNKTCGFKKGSEARVRLPLRSGPPVDGPLGPPVDGPLGPPVDGTPPGPGAPPAPLAPPPCEPQTERRKCVVMKTPCTRGTETNGN